MKMRSLLPLTLLLATAASVRGVNINFSGQIETTNLTTHTWVLGTTMWGTVNTGTAIATSQTGFNSLAGLDMSKFGWTYGKLNLTQFQEPTANGAGFEYYTRTTQSFDIIYNGSLLATGDVLYLRSEVLNSSDINATGTGRVQLTAPGQDSAFYNEVMSLTGNTGLLDMQINSFVAVSAPGVDPGYFSSTGVLSPIAVPEPALFAYGFGGIALLLALMLRKR
ncbi:MAG: hypothetical protein SFY80_13075 [Verrucomicrobiota bacterium]|nr:hypothetical protein [Verrucomicrobiota bacterium]